MEAWIEIVFRMLLHKIVIVASFMEAWIEMKLNRL